MKHRVNRLFRMTTPLLFLSSLTAAAAGNSDAFVNVSGSVTSPTCVVNGGKPIEVNFNNIPVAELSDPKYSKTTRVSVVCPYYNGAPFVKIMATPLGSQGNVVATSTKNFGIALYQATRLDKPLLLGAGSTSGGNSYGYRITWGLDQGGVMNDAFTFTAVPYKLGSEDLSPGPFSASATIAMSYI